jgi:hypothetical protein
VTIDPNVFTIDAVLADSAVTADGKLYVQGGGWHILGTASFPVQVPRIAIALVIGVPYAATNRAHTLEINFEGDDGPIPLGHSMPAGGEAPEPMMGLSNQFNIGRPPSIQPGDRQAIPMAMNFNSMQFDRAGTYSFTFAIDGEEMNRLTFRVTGPPTA